VFDRVVVTKDSLGRALSATVYDFKTDRNIASDRSLVTVRHESQIAHYRRVVAVLTGLPEREVRATLVLTETPEMVDVPFKD